MTDCLLLRKGPNGLFNCAHIVRSDKISYLPLQMTWNSCLKIAKHFRMAQFAMHFQLSMLLSVLSEVACEGQQCTVHTVSQKGEETILHVLHWFLVGKQILDCGFSLHTQTHTHTMLFHCLGCARSLPGDGETRLECAHQSPQTSKTGNISPLPHFIYILFSLHMSCVM